MKRCRPLLFLSLFALTQSGCSWHRDLVLDEVGSYETIQVTTSHGTERLRNPTVDADTLFGTTPDGASRRIPYEEVASVEASGTDVAGTVVLAVLGAGLVAAIIGLATYEMCILSC